MNPGPDMVFDSTCSSLVVIADAVPHVRQSLEFHLYVAAFVLSFVNTLSVLFVVRCVIAMSVLSVVRLLSSPCRSKRLWTPDIFLGAGRRAMALSLELVFWDEIIDRVLAFICSSSYWSLIWWLYFFCTYCTRTDPNRHWEQTNRCSYSSSCSCFLYMAVWLNAGDCWWAKCMTRQRLLCLTLYTCWKNMVLFRMVQDPTTLTEGDNSVWTRLIFSLHVQPKTFKGRFMYNVCLKLYA